MISVFVQIRIFIDLIFFQTDAVYRFRINTKYSLSANSATEVEASTTEPIRLPRFDTFLRKFQYSKALDAVLIPYIRKKKPSVAVGLMKELLKYVRLNYRL